MFGRFVKQSDVRRLAPIVVVMPNEALAFVNCRAAFERIAGSPFLNCVIVSLQKKKILTSISCG